MILQKNFWKKRRNCLHILKVKMTQETKEHRRFTQTFPIILKINRWSFGKPWIAGEGNWKIYYVKHMIKSMENKFPDFGV